jgi:hypothetical protein
MAMTTKPVELNRCDRIKPRFVWLRQQERLSALGQGATIEWIKPKLYDYDNYDNAALAAR